MNILQTITPTKPLFDNTIKTILAKKEYASLTNPIKDFLDTLKENISNWLLGILNHTFSNVKASSISNKLSTVFIIIGIVAILAIIIFIIIKATNTINKGEKITEILGERIDERTTPNSLRNKAREEEGKGEHRLAIRYDFIAILLLMHMQNLIYLEDNKTNEEIYNYLKKINFTKQKDFKQLVDHFNTVWYGNKLTNAASYDNWSSNLNSLWNEVLIYEEKN